MSVCVFLCGGVRRCVRGVPELCALFSVCRVCEFVGVTLLFFDLFCVCVLSGCLCFPCMCLACVRVCVCVCLVCSLCLVHLLCV